MLGLSISRRGRFPDVFVVYFAPTTITLVVWIAQTITEAEFGSVSFAEALLVSGLMLSTRVLTLAVALRDLSRWRRSPAPAANRDGSVRYRSFAGSRTLLDKVFDRSRYLAALRRADGGDHGPLGEFVARAVLDNLYKFVVPAVAGPARLVPLPALATKQLSANALRVAAIRGRLKAAKAADGTWRSSKAWVDEYRATRYKRS